MSTDQDVNYDAVLEDLRSKRDKLSTAIAAIEQLVLGREAAQDGSAPADQNVEAGQKRRRASGKIASDAFFGMSAADAAKAYLEMAKKPSSIREIQDALLSGGYLSNAKNFYSNLYTTVSRRDDVFVKVDKKWGLVGWYGGRKMLQKQTAQSATTNDEGERSEANADDGETEG